MTSGAAGDRLAVGEQVASVPQSIEAMAGGDIGFSHLALIAREAIALQESGSKRPFDETPLLNKALDSPSADFATIAITTGTPSIQRAMRSKRPKPPRPEP